MGGKWPPDHTPYDESHELLGGFSAEELVSFVDDELSEDKSNEISTSLLSAQKNLSSYFAKKPEQFLGGPLAGRARGLLAGRAVRRFESTADYLKAAGRQQKPAGRLVKRLKAIMKEIDK
jgi:hypothetical protein